MCCFFLCDRPESGSGGADGGGAPAAGVSAGGPEPLPRSIGQSEPPAHQQMHVATAGQTHAVQLSGKQSATKPGTNSDHEMNG